MMGRRKVEFNSIEQEILEVVFDQSAKWRNY